MPEADLYLLFIRPFHRADIRYMVGGSVAVIFYGEPRLTHDVDLIAFPSGADIAKLPELFPPGEFYLPPADIVAIEAKHEQRGSFNIIHVPVDLRLTFTSQGATTSPRGDFAIREHSCMRVSRLSLPRLNT